MSCKDLFKWIFEFDIYIEILVKPTMIINLIQIPNLPQEKCHIKRYLLTNIIFLSHVPISNLLQTKYLALHSIL